MQIKALVKLGHFALATTKSNKLLKKTKNTKNKLWLARCLKMLGRINQQQNNYIHRRHVKIIKKMKKWKFFFFASFSQRFDAFFAEILRFERCKEEQSLQISRNPPKWAFVRYRTCPYSRERASQSLSVISFILSIRSLFTCIGRVIRSGAQFAGISPGYSFTLRTTRKLHVISCQRQRPRL